MHPWDDVKRLCKIERQNLDHIEDNERLNMVSKGCRKTNTGGMNAPTFQKINKIYSGQITLIWLRKGYLKRETDFILMMA